MGFNYGYEKKKFDSRWKRLEVEYCDAGMSEEQIAAMKEYDWAWFCSQRVFQNHRNTSTYENWGMSSSLVNQAWEVSPENVTVSYTTGSDTESFNIDHRP